MVISNLNPGTGNYTLPAATASTLGGVKVGSSMSVGNDGTIEAVTASKLVMLDPTNNKKYTLQFKLVSGKPTIEYEEVLTS